MYDPASPKGFYFNRGVFYFCRKIENDQNIAENNSRKHRKPGADVDRLVNAARLRILELALGTPVKRHKDPGNVSNMNPFQQHGAEKKADEKDSSTIVMRGF
jgi:hypothetical protein